MSKTMEIIKKQNANLISWHPIRREREREERHKEKDGENDQESSALDHEITVQGSSIHATTKETHNVDDEVKDLKLKYAEMARQMA